MSVLFLSKHKPFSKDAAHLIQLHMEDTEIIFGENTDPFPEHLYEKKFDYVISYVAPWIIPRKVLENAGIAAINLHPGPPGYPGIGCTNFAIYNGEKTFGITVHYMKEKVDSGDIIAVERFPIFENDTVHTLTQRCYIYIYTAFIKLFPFILKHQCMPRSGEDWARKPYTRRELNELCIIRPDMPEGEVRRRVRATTYPAMPGAYIELYGHHFDYNQGK